MILFFPQNYCYFLAFTYIVESNNFKIYIYIYIYILCNWKYMLVLCNGCVVLERYWEVIWKRNHHGWVSSLIRGLLHTVCIVNSISAVDVSCVGTLMSFFCIRTNREPNGGSILAMTSIVQLYRGILWWKPSWCCRACEAVLSYIRKYPSMTVPL